MSFSNLFKSDKGMTLVEISIVSGLILIILSGAYLLLESTQLTYERSINQTLSTRDARFAVNVIADEIKTAIPPDSYVPSIEKAGNNEIIFFQDKDGDGIIERVKIYRDNNNLIQEIQNQVEGSSPPVFTEPGNSKVMIKSLDPNQVTIFQYYDNGNPPQLTSDLNNISSVKIMISAVSKISSKEKIVELEETCFIRSKSEILE